MYGLCVSQIVSNRPEKIPNPAAEDGPRMPPANIQGMVEKTIIAGPVGSSGTPGGGERTLAGKRTPMNRLVIGTQRDRMVRIPQNLLFIGLL